MRASAFVASGLLALSIALLKWPTPLHAQDTCDYGPPSFTRLTVEDGLSSNTVRTIFEDSRGFVWIGTADGLNRYDGYNFSVYRHQSDNAGTIAGNIVNGLAEDANGILWIASARGVSRLDPVTQSITSYVFPVDGTAAGSSTRSLPVRAVSVDDDGRVWIATFGGGLGVLQPRADQFLFFRRDPTLSDSEVGDLSPTLSESGVPSDSVSALLVARDGAVWFATNSTGLSRLDPASGKYDNYRAAVGDPEALPSNRIRSLREDAEGALILGFWGGGVARMPISNPGRFSRLASAAELGSANVESAILDSRGTLWAASYARLVARVTYASEASATSSTPVATAVRTFTHQPSDAYSVGDGEVAWILEDHTGAVWLGGNAKGISRFDPVASSFCHVRHVGSDATTLPGSGITAVAVDSAGTLWVGTRESGLARRATGSDAFTHYRHDQANAASLPDDRVLSLAVDGRGVLWVGTQQGLTQYDPQRASFRRVDARRGLGAVNALVPSRWGFLWIGSSAGVARLDPASGAVAMLDGKLASRRFPASLLEASDGTLWVAYDNGELFLHRRDGTTRAYEGDSTTDQLLVDARTQALMQDRSGRIWAGTGAGLFLIDDGKGGSGKRYTMLEGLPNNVVKSIVEDDDGALWLGTSGGLSRFDPQSESFRNFGIADGLQGLGFESAALRDARGRLFFGGSNGLNMFHPSAIPAEPQPLRVAFTTLALPDSVIDVSARKSVELNYRNRLVTLTIAALGPVPADGVTYAYRIDASATDDAPWTSLGTRNNLSLAGLSANRHIVRVRATSSSGRWLPAEAQLEINIRPPWWRTKLSLLVYLLIGVSALYLGLRYERNRALLKDRLRLEHATSQKLRELDDAKSRLLANLSHEFRTPLTLIIGPLQQLVSESRDKRHAMMLRNARRLQRLISQVLQLSKLEEGHMKVRPANGDLAAFTRAIVHAMRPLADREGVQLAMTEEQTVATNFDPELMERVVGNLISNALKFTPEGGRVDVAVGRDPRGAFVSVADTGIGISAAQLPHVFDRFFQADASSKRRYDGSGIGLALVKELVELHGGSVEATSEEGRGSTFVARLPDTVSGDGAFGAATIDATIEAAIDADDVTAIGRDGSNGKPAAQDATQAADPSAEEHVGEGAEDRKRVLIVDDNGDLRAYTRSLFEDHYEVHEARDGVEGLEVARSVLPDVVVADVMMPRLDGNEMSAALREDPTLAGVAVILLTALADPADEVAGFGAGADQYVTKPFEPEVLLARVASVLQIRERLVQRGAASTASTAAAASTAARADVASATIPAATDDFEARLLGVVQENLSDRSFSVERMAEALAMSPSQLRRRVSAALGESPNAVLRGQRLAHAAQLLRDGAGNVSEIAYASGFNSIHYFSRVYRQHFGVAPSDHLNRSSRS